MWKRTDRGAFGRRRPLLPGGGYAGTWQERTGKQRDSLRGRGHRRWGRGRGRVKICSGLSFTVDAAEVVGWRYLLRSVETEAEETD